MVEVKHFSISCYKQNKHDAEINKLTLKKKNLLGSILTGDWAAGKRNVQVPSLVSISNTFGNSELGGMAGL